MLAKSSKTLKKVNMSWWKEDRNQEVQAQFKELKETTKTFINEK